MTDADHDQLARDILEEIGAVVKIKSEKRYEVEGRIKAVLVNHDMKEEAMIECPHCTEMNSGEQYACSFCGKPLRTEGGRC